MHTPKRKPAKFGPHGGKLGRKALDEKTFTATVHLDVKCAQWLQREAHERKVSRSKIMRELIVMEMKREEKLARQMRQDRSLEDRMDRMAGSA